jgi:hypothetical protein
MKEWNQWSAAAALALGVLTLSATPLAYAQTPAVDPAALQKLERMTKFLDGMPQLSVKTFSTLEDIHASGHRVDHEVAANVIVKRPDKLVAMRVGGLLDQRLYYDGKTLTLYNPSEKVYASEPAPPTVEKAIDFARETVGVLLPAADLMYRNAYPLLTQGLTLATVVGEAVIGGVKSDHLLFSRPGVDFQIWIAQGSQPWPQKYTVTDTASANLLSVTTRFSGWNSAPAAGDAKFAFEPPKGTQKIRFMSIEPARPTERK